MPAAACRSRPTAARPGGTSGVVTAMAVIIIARTSSRASLRHPHEVPHPRPGPHPQDELPRRRLGLLAGPREHTPAPQPVAPHRHRGRERPRRLLDPALPHVFDEVAGPPTDGPALDL